MAKNYAAGLLSALASAHLGVEQGYCDGLPFKFSPFSTSSASPAPSTADPGSAAATKQSQLPAAAAAAAEPPKVRNDNPRTTSAGFDPEALERGAKALREINNSAHAKKVQSV